MTTQELKKIYKLDEGQMKKIRDAMEIAHKSIQKDVPNRQSSFEQRIAKIVDAAEGDWHVAEEFALAYYLEKKWTEVFEEFYGTDLKFKDYIRN